MTLNNDTVETLFENILVFYKSQNFVKAWIENLVTLSPLRGVFVGVGRRRRRRRI